MPGPVIAVVNDDEAYLNLMDDLLTGEGYQTVLLTEGDPAYQAIRKEMPHLVILDIRLEHSEAGWTILESLRLDPAIRDTPVIICSADAQFLQAKAHLLREKGCDILEKPFNLEDLLAKVQAAIGSPSTN